MLKQIHNSSNTLLLLLSDRGFMPSSWQHRTISLFHDKQAGEQINEVTLPKVIQWFTGEMRTHTICACLN